MRSITDAIGLCVDHIKKEQGHLNPGDQWAFVFEDGVVIISQEDDRTSVQCIRGEPVRFEGKYLLQPEA